MREGNRVKMLAGRDAASFGRVDAVVLGLFCVLSGGVTFYHEPWADEAQAWMLARSNGLGALLFEHLHHEGSPGLWHVLLWIFCRLHLPYCSMQAAAFLAGVAAVFLLLRFSPFPSLVRWLLPFTVALFYQVPIVARSYSLIPLLAFALCALFGAAKPRLLLFALLAGLLANTALIGFFLALGLSILYWFWRVRPEPHSTDAKPLAAAALVAVLGLFAVYTALPSPDTNEGKAQELSTHPREAALLGWLTGDARHCPVRLTTADSTVTGDSRPAFGYVALPHHSGGKYHGFPAACIHFFSLMFFPVSGSNLLALAFYAALLYWLWSHRALAAAIPLLATLVGAKMLPFSEHHMLVLWTAIVVTLWLAWTRVDSGKILRADWLFVLILLPVLAQQLAWAAFAAAWDVRNPYDGGAAAARYLIDHAAGGTIAGFNYHSVGLQPYAARSLFVNQTSTYWPWNCAADSDARLPETLLQHPDFVLDGESFSGNVSWRNQIVQEKPVWTRSDPDGIDIYLVNHGYRPAHRFCGSQPAHFGFSEQTCETIYEPVTPSIH
jgi:hypothetical protein